ncbi:thiol-disulfide oxidoreductase DCC family protein [Flavobacterium difficile]|uniref:thiol-disulfide oxidoreductase DCC family protein n=1 Tax=Flavobacterium difficile TaxID=2709659 RepID=UPI001A9C7993|nr:DCC1-like thiol-disulfide oxidoreductase family protein [Flavobacterium difficile]
MDIENLPKDKKIILFDGICNYCNDKINFVIRKDKNDVFRFVPLQSETGQKIIQYLGINPSIDSIILYEPGYAYFIKSEAVFRIIKDLSSSVKVLLLFTFIPTSIKNIFYDIIARNRYNWFGKKESCMIPTLELKSKFLE